MKVEFGNITLAGGLEENETPIDFKITGQRAVQIASTIRGDEIKAIDRGNLNTRVEFRVKKKHDTAEEAQNYAIRHASELYELQTYLTITGEPSNTNYYLPHAVMLSVESSNNGNTSEHFYKILGGMVSTSIN